MFVASGMLTCCYEYDDSAVYDEEGISDDFGLAFDIEVNMVPGGITRAETDYTDVSGDLIDSEIDVSGTNHDFRVLLFDKDDKFLFEPTRNNKEYALWEIGEGYDYDEDNNYPSDVNTRRWRIRIPAVVLRENGVLETVKNNDFKIAILANWPKDKKVVTFEKGENLYKLSHYYDDSAYQNEAYSFLADNGKMGAYVGWVKNGYSKQTEAEDTIRSGTDRNAPHIIVRKAGSYAHTYKHIWRVWQFGNISELNSISKNPKFVEAWKTKFTDAQSLLTNVSTSGFSNYGGFYNNDGLDLLGVNGSSYEIDNCLVLAEGLTADEIEAGNSITKNRLRFTAFAEGTLRITAKSEGGIIYVQTKDNSSNEKNPEFRTKWAVSSADYETKDFKISVTGSGSSNPETAPYSIPEIISIFSVGGNVDIKKIEYIEDSHLYNTDREGILPEEGKQLIPMYGIQTYAAIGKYFVPGGTLNLSTLTEGVNDGYPRKKLYLLRSVAKVELLIPNSFPELAHAYMRSFNRSGRCEPVDVSTPTNTLWSNVDTEIDNIRKYGAFYDSKVSDLDSYHKKLSWFYGVWNGWWNWNNKNPQIPTSYEFPHIFNTRIERSDYAHFHKMERTTVNGIVYNRYVLYMPEKNIDDPNSHGKMNSTPKIPHIELRFAGINNDENLDDNDCYRIYFTDRNNEIPSISSAYDGEELKHLGILYPIVRNHIYRFTVNGFDGSDLKVTVDVDPWDEAELNPKFGNDDKDGVIDNDPWDEKDLNPAFGLKE